MDADTPRRRRRRFVAALALYVGWIATLASWARLRAHAPAGLPAGAAATTDQPSVAEPPERLVPAHRSTNP